MGSSGNITEHIATGNILMEILHETKKHIQQTQHISEYDVQQFICKECRQRNIYTDKDLPIVAFNENTALVHYFPQKKSKILQQDSLILIDIRAQQHKKKSIFADITRMFRYGNKIPEEIQHIRNSLHTLRTNLLAYIQKVLTTKNIPTGKELHTITEMYMKENGYTNPDNLYTGHSIGTSSCHGKYKGINASNTEPLQKNICYTIEPGIYIPKKFGIRTELDFTITDAYTLHITTPIQQKIEIIHTI